MATQNWLSLNDFLGQQFQTLRPSDAYMRAFSPGEGQTYENMPYNPNMEYGMATGDYAGAGGPNQTAWLAQQVLGGKTPEQYIASRNQAIGLGPNNITGNDRGGFAWDPNTQRVLVRSFDDEFDPGQLIMGGLAAGLGGLSGGFGIGELLGGAGNALGAAEEIAGLTGGGVGGGGAATGAATGATTGGVSGITNGAGSLSEFLPQTGSFVGDPALGGIGGITESATALAPTQNIGLGATYAGGTTGGLGSILNSVTTPTTGTGTGSTAGGTSNDIIEQTGNFTGGGTTATTTAGTTAATGTPMSRVLEALTNGGTPAMADLLSIGGTLGSTLLGIYGSNQQGDALRDLANQSRADRQPFLNKSLEWLNDPAAYTAGPGQAALQGVLRGLSVNGNPFGNPTSLALAGDIANRNWQNAVTGFGNIGLSGQDSRNQIQSAAINADSGALDALGYGLENIFAPRQQNASLNNLLRQFGLV